MNELQEDLSAEFFRPLFEPDERMRAEALKAIIDLLKQSLDTTDKALVKVRRMNYRHLYRQCDVHSWINGYDWITP